MAFEVLSEAAFQASHVLYHARPYPATPFSMVFWKIICWKVSRAEDCIDTFVELCLQFNGLRLADRYLTLHLYTRGRIFSTQDGALSLGRALRALGRSPHETQKSV